VSQTARQPPAQGILNGKEACIVKGSSTPERESEATQLAIQERLPLTPAVFHILLALAEGERHGYAIMREVAEQTAGQMRLGPGTLYGSIRRMLADGLIEESEARPDPALDDERRRYYRLTPFGRRVAEAEAARLQALTQAARARGLLPDPPGLRGGSGPHGLPAGAGGPG